MENQQNQPALDDWLTKQQAAQFLGVAEKTVDRMAAKGELQKAERKRPGKAPVVVFHPDDVGRARAVRQQPPPPFIVPHSDTAVQPMSDLSPTVEHESGARSDVSRETSVHLILSRLASVLEMAPASTIPLHHKVYLTMPEARQLTGLSEDRILAAAKDGRVRKEGRLYYRRRDLENL
jgi:predicted DNA-binding transcriptional regulator AlpA